MRDPEELRRQADEAERLASLVSYAKDKGQLREKAAELRRQAAALEAECKHTRR